VRSFAILLVLLAGCATVKDETTMPVHVVWQNVDDVQATCEEISGRREVFRILGCSKWRDVGGQRTCTIYAQAPRDERDLQRFATLGHELMHCTDGNWHDRWGRMTDAKVRQAKAGERSSAAAGASAAATAAASASQD
jgi:hypothetical protein